MYLKEIYIGLPVNEDWQLFFQTFGTLKKTWKPIQKLLISMLVLHRKLMLVSPRKLLAMGQFLDVLLVIYISGSILKICFILKLLLCTMYLIFFAGLFSEIFINPLI